jgi:7,8-dihydropterin-6-yl-methyl-4-(beta-D-ribofuranosyl)aminobenzene 5'-phosphate synthase
MEKAGLLSELRITVMAEDSVQYESPLLGQHGIALLLEARSAEGRHMFLVDVGQNSSALRHNMLALGVQFSALDAIILTHCHYDHTQGTSDVLRWVGKQGVPVVAHPSSFRPHFVTAPCLRHVGMMPSDSRSKIEEAGGLLLLTRDPLQLMPGLSTTGEVRRQTDFEEVGIPLKTVVEERVVGDTMLDDISVVACVRDQGLVIITGCSHAGIVNIVKHSIELFEEKRICGIIGGFHLLNASDERIQKTVDALSRHNPNPQWISAGHCTGFKAQVALFLKFGERFRPLQTGMTFTV